MIPENFNEWYRCLTVTCGIKPNAAFLEDRIKALENKSDSYTAIFIKLYGMHHYENVVSWFYMARQKLVV